MKQLITFLLVVISIPAFSQEVEWFQPNQEWYYNVYCFQEYACGYTHYDFAQTEIIGGEEATLLNRSYSDENVDEPILNTEHLRFENDTVWRYSAVAEQWHMLWDIGADVGDVWIIQEDVFYGYENANEPEEIALFKVMVDSVAIWEEVPDSPLTDRRVIYTLPLTDENEESQYVFGPILEGVGPIGGAHDLIGNWAENLLPLQSPTFQCFLDNGDLAYGSADSPCNTLSASEPVELKSGLVYPNPAMDFIKWDEPIDQVTLIDPTGKIVLQKQINGLSNELSLDGLPRGFYTVVMQDGKGSFSQKLIVQ
jgi:hypothetical protein